MLSLGLNRLMLVIAPRLGLMDEPGERRIHATAVPRAGGLAIWLTFLIVILWELMVDWQVGQGGNLSWRWLRGFTAGSLVLIIAGFIDDRKGLSPWVKLCAHILAPSLFFMISPIRSGIFEGDHAWFADFGLFVAWSVVLINAFNLIDGLDGLCGGLATVASLALGGLAIANQRLDAALLLFAMGGAILGFLRYNFNPARLFLGDAGSMLIGFFLATAATEAVGRKAVVGVLLLPIAVAGVPLLDLLLAVWRRGARKLARKLRGEAVSGGIFDADADHLHHRILASGQSQRRTALVLQGIAIVLTVLAFLPMLFGNRLLALSLVGFLVVALVGIRNLARVELEQTGSVVHMAIKLPGQRRKIAALLFVYDVMVLLCSGAAAVVMETNRFVRPANLDTLWSFVMVFAVFSSLFMWRVRVHQRLWIRATMLDLVRLQVSLLIAALATFTLFSLVFEELEWSSLRLTMLSYVFACIGLSLPRISLDVLRELGTEARYKNPQNAKPGAFGPVVILGAGDLGALFLDHLKSSPHDYYHGMSVLGFVDQSVELHGRHMRSFPVLGSLALVPSLVENEGLKGIIVAIANPPATLREELATLADTHKIHIHFWRVNLESQ